MRPEENCDHRAVRIVAVDWSGKLKGAAESLWRAEVRDGTGAGRRREAAVRHAVASTGDVLIDPLEGRIRQ